MQRWMAGLPVASSMQLPAVVKMNTQRLQLPLCTVGSGWFSKQGHSQHTPLPIRTCFICAAPNGSSESSSVRPKSYCRSGMCKAACGLVIQAKPAGAGRYSTAHSGNQQLHSVGATAMQAHLPNAAVETMPHASASNTLVALPRRGRASPTCEQLSGRALRKQAKHVRTFSLPKLNSPASRNRSAKICSSSCGRRSVSRWSGGPYKHKIASRMQLSAATSVDTRLVRLLCAPAWARRHWRAPPHRHSQGRKSPATQGVHKVNCQLRDQAKPAASGGHSAHRMQQRPGSAHCSPRWRFPSHQQRIVILKQSRLLCSASECRRRHENDSDGRDWRWVG